MKNSIASLENELISIMGQDENSKWGSYEKVKLFFKMMFTAKVTKIIAEGRTYALYKIFEGIFENEGLERGGKIYTTYALSQIPKNQQRVLFIIDDIQDAASYNKYLDEILERHIVQKENLICWCIACEAEVAKWIDRSHFHHVIYMTRFEAKKLSMVLNNVVMNTNVGYLSSVNSYVFNKLTFGDIEKAKHRCIIENNLESFIEDITSRILWDDFLDRDIISTYRVKTCIRFYKKKDQIIAVPYVFLPALKSSQVISYCKDLLAFYKLEYPTSFETDRELLYKWTVYSLSKVIFRNFISKNKDETEKWEYDIIDNSNEIFGINEYIDFSSFARCTFSGNQIAADVIDKKDVSYQMFFEFVDSQYSLSDVTYSDFNAIEPIPRASAYGKEHVRFYIENCYDA